MKLELVVDIVAPPALPSKLLDVTAVWLTDSAVADFIRAGYLPDSFTGFRKEYVEKATAMLARTIFRNLRSGNYRSICTPHPECVLIQHHHNNSHFLPLPYIGDNHPLCLQCEIFLHAYNKHACTTGRTVFSARERDGHLIPYFLPTVDGADDPIIDDLIVGMRACLNAVVIAAVKDLSINMRRPNFSTSLLPALPGHHADGSRGSRGQVEGGTGCV